MAEDVNKGLELEERKMAKEPKRGDRSKKRLDR